MKKSAAEIIKELRDYNSGNWESLAIDPWVEGQKETFDFFKKDVLSNGSNFVSFGNFSCIVEKREEEILNHIRKDGKQTH